MPQVKVGSFSLNASAGAQQVTGFDFEPKLVIVFGQEQLTSNGMPECRRSWGAATSNTARFCTAGSANLGDNGYTNQQFMSNRIIHWNDSLSDNTIIDADFTAMLADGFEIYVNTGKAVTLHYMAFGGEDFEAFVGIHDVPEGVEAGNISATGVPFTPKAFLIHHGPQKASESYGSQNEHSWTLVSGAGLDFTVAGLHTFIDLSPAKAKSAMWSEASDRFITNLSGGTSGEPNVSTSFVSMDAAGFTYMHRFVTQTMRCGFIAFGGEALYQVANITAPAAVGAQSSNVGFIPEALMTFTHGYPADTWDIARDALRCSWGVGTVADQRATGLYAVDASTAAYPTSTSVSDACLIVPGTTDASVLTKAAMIGSAAADSFTLNYTTHNGTLFNAAVLAIGSNDMQADITVTDDEDAISASVTHTNYGAIETTDDEDTITANAANVNGGVIFINDEGDTLEFTATATNRLSVSLADDSDSIAADAALVISLTVSVTDEGDTITAAGITRPQTRALKIITVEPQEQVLTLDPVHHTLRIEPEVHVLAVDAIHNVVTVTEEEMAIQTFTKQSGDTDDIDVDYRAWLKRKGDDTLTVEPEIIVEPGITLESSVLAGGILKMFFSGGTDRQKYKVTTKATTTGGRVKEKEFYINIKDE